MVEERIRMFLAGPEASTRFHTFNWPPTPLIYEMSLAEVVAALPSCSVPPVTICVAERMSTSSVVLLPLTAIMVPPDQFRVVALPSRTV